MQAGLWFVSDKVVRNSDNVRHFFWSQGSYVRKTDIQEGKGYFLFQSSEMSQLVLNKFINILDSGSL